MNLAVDVSLPLFAFFALVGVRHAVRVFKQMRREHREWADTPVALITSYDDAHDWRNPTSGRMMSVRTVKVLTADGRVILCKETA